jgi:hypothetical protein
VPPVFVGSPLGAAPPPPPFLTCVASLSYDSFYQYIEGA